MSGEGLEVEVEARECWSVSFRCQGQEVARVQLHRHSEDVFEVVDLYVVPEWRGRGLARHVLAHCLDLVRARGGRMVVAHTSPDNAPAFRVFSRQGFLPCLPELHLELHLDHHRPHP
jgi:ribosomal protein S18 acetylase RimI-like enzyme